jgi:hypothetical protein
MKLRETAKKNLWITEDFILLCGLEVDRRFRGVHYLQNQGDESSVYYNADL